MKPTSLEASAAICLMCGAGDLHESVEQERFPVGEQQTIAVADVPVLSCGQCGFSFTDARAEPIRHDAACLVQGLLPPDEIKAVRALYGMNRREFAEAFKIGHATLERWENRKLFISGQSNFYLKALQDVKVGQKLLQQSAPASTMSEGSDNVIAVDFQALHKARLRYKAALRRREKFNLKRAAR